MAKVCKTKNCNGKLCELHKRRLAYNGRGKNGAPLSAVEWIRRKCNTCRTVQTERIEIPAVEKVTAKSKGKSAPVKR